MIDANESMTKTNSGISNLISVTQLCDPIFMLHGAHKEPNTYIRGSGKNDYFFCSPKLLQYIQRCGILPFDMATTVDHILRDYIHDAHVFLSLKYRWFERL